MINKVVVSKVIKEDYENLIFFLEHFYSDRPEKNWSSRIEYWWDKNPSFNHNCIRGAKLVDQTDNKIIGFIGLIPLKLKLKSSIVIAYAFTSWRVHEEYRKHSLELLYFLDNLLADKICFNYTANQIAKFYFKKLNFEKITNGTINSYFYFNNTFFNRIFLKYKIPILGSFVDLFFEIFQNFSIKKFKNHKINIIYQTKDFSDINTLWVNTNSAITCVERNSDFLEWLNSNPTRNLYTVNVYSSDAILAYMTFTMVNGKYRKLICSDYWGELDKFIIRAVIKTLKKILKNNDIDFDFIEIPIFNKNNFLKKLNLIKITRNDERLYRLPNHIEEESLSSVFFSGVEGGFGK